MSLINDALKRAQNERPKDNAVAAGPPMRPVDPAKRKGVLPPFAAPLLLAVLLIGAGVLMWQAFTSGGHELKVRANTPPPRAQAPAQSVVATTPATNTPAEPAPAVAAQPVVEVPVAAPVTYQLQSIFYRAKNPSAVINGKTIFVGDRVNGARVLSIDKDSATILTPGGQTNILDLQ